MIVGVILGIPLLIVFTVVSIVLLIVFNELSDKLLRRQRTYKFMLITISVGFCTFIIWRVLVWIALM